MSSRLPIPTVALLVLFSIFSTGISAADLPAVADSFTHEGYVDKNYGGYKKLRVTTWKNRTSYIRFAQPADASSAILQLTLESVEDSGFVDVHVVQSDWTEQGITANRLPTIDPAPIASLRVDKGDDGQTVSADVTPALQAWLAAPNTNFGLALVPSGREYMSLSIRSRETSGPPLLVTDGSAGDNGDGPSGDDGTGEPQPDAPPATVVADSFTNLGDSSKNYGGRTRLRVSTWQDRTGFFRFAQPEDASSATMRLTVESVEDAGFVDVHVVQSGWTERGITADTAPIVDPVPIATLRIDKADEGRQIDVDVTAALQSWLAAPNTNFGLALVPSTREYMSIGIRSRETTDPPLLLSGGAAGDDDPGGGDDPGPGQTNAPPSANDDNFTVNPSDEDAQLNVLSNDSDPDFPGDSLTIVYVSATSNGGEVINDETALRYTPAPGFSGIEVFTYTVEDESGARASAQVSVDVRSVVTGSVTLTWTPPATNTDGSPLLNLAAYKFYHGRSANELDNVIRVDNPGLSAYVIEGLSPGTHYFATTVVNSHGVESDISNVASASVATN